VLTNHKVLRFACLTSAYQELLKDFCLLDYVDYSALASQISELDRYKKLDRVAKYLIEIFRHHSNDKFWELYLSKLELTQQENLDFVYKLAYEKEHIDFAVRNAFFAYLSIIHLLPKLYRRQFGKEMQSEEFKLASKNALALIYKLSKFHFDVFRAFIYASSQINHGVNKDLHVLKLDRFCFKDDLVLDLSKKANLQIKLEAEKLSKKGKLRTNQAAIGCPALSVELDPGLDLVKQGYLWVLAVLDKLDLS
jgi:hypothetical protein